MRTRLLVVMGHNLNFTDSERKAWSNFLTAHSRVLAKIDSDLIEDCNLTLGDFDVLRCLLEADRHQLRMNELAEFTRLSPSGLTRRFDVLANRGWVTRERCDDDRRGVVAVLTKDGLKKVRAAAPVHDRGERDYFLDVLGEKSTKTLATAMYKIAEANAPEELTSA